MEEFIFHATYLTNAGNMGTANINIKAESIEEAMEEGTRRVHRRKSYCGKMDASCCKKETNHA